LAGRNTGLLAVDMIGREILFTLVGRGCCLLRICPGVMKTLSISGYDDMKN